MSEENLWGDISVSDNQRTPVAVLREQVSFLSQMTKGLLLASVVSVTGGNPNILMYNFDLKAPALNNYTMTLFTIQHPITIFPVTFINRVQGGQKLCNDEKDFVQTVKGVLSSEQVKKIASALLVQSREIKQG